MKLTKKNPPFFLLRYKYIRKILMNIHSMDLAHAHLMYIITEKTNDHLKPKSQVSFTSVNVPFNGRRRTGQMRSTHCLNPQLCIRPRCNQRQSWLPRPPTQRRADPQSPQWDWRNLPGPLEEEERGNWHSFEGLVYYLQGMKLMQLH